jgi:hypothetical protein
MEGYMSDWEGTEAEAHSENVECFLDEEYYDEDGDVCEAYDSRGRCVVSNGIRVLSTEKIDLFKMRYDKAKASPVKTSINCPTCNKRHLKTTYHKVFCGRKRCKDEYWNTVDDVRRSRAKEYKNK